jgi:glycosyltransferase involved in cell wall biosynthesis
MGNVGRNDGLEAIRDGWVWFLDDDNLPHAEFAAGLLAAVVDHPNAEGLVFDQFVKDGELRLKAKVDAGYAEVDSAQFVFRRSVIGPHRWVVDDYAADAGFFVAVSRELRERGTITAPSSGAVWYNRLR